MPVLQDPRTPPPRRRGTDEDGADVVVLPTVLAPGLVADELTGLVEMVVVGDPDVDESAATGTDAQLAVEIAEAEALVDGLAEQVRGAAEVVAVAEMGEDEALVLAARGGDDEALTTLLTKYRAFTRLRARSYFLVGGDREDVVQEGMIGLYKAVRDFDPAMATSFRSFAELCVTRQILTAIKSATRHKHGPLNDYVSFERPVGEEDGTERTLSDVLPARSGGDPADLVISAERVRALQAHFDEVLSDLETEVLRMYVDGQSYQEIAERLQRQTKSIDNALQRVKKKLEAHLRDRAAADGG